MKVRQDPSTKPYFRCLSCPRFRKGCGGIPTREMDLQGWCEYMRDVKDIAHLTNAYIAEKAEVSVKTIERIMAINIEQDIMRATARRIELVVIGPAGRHICELDYDVTTAKDTVSQLMAENEALKLRLSQLDELHRADVRAIREEYLEQINFLKDELKSRRIVQHQ